MRSNPVQASIPITDINRTQPRVPKVSYSGKDRGQFRWDDRPAKDTLRHLIADSVSGKQNLLVMPGSLGRDIQLLKHYGSTKPGASWTIVERDLRQYELLLEQRLFAKRDEVIPHLSDFTTLRTGDDYDFAWFDLLGNLRLQDMYWFRDHFVPNTDLDLVFGFMVGGRGTRISTFSILKNTLAYTSTQEMRALLDRINIPRSGRTKTGSLALDKNIATHLAIFDYLFSGWNFDVEIWLYADTVPFVAYKLNNFVKTQQVTPLMKQVDLILDFVSNVRADLPDK